MNRHQRRIAAKKGLTAGLAGLAKTSTQIDEVLGALRRVEGLEGAVNTLSEIRSEIQKTHDLMGMLAEDIQTLNTEMELQREVTMRLVAHFIGVPTASAETVRAYEAAVRAESTQRTTNESG